ncbi:hypothetical protein ACFYKT_18330 [Cytobacillus sp. FJAT-53684]|uniref:Uncharacterized protein n=1 Tax=Cytobacillus mangrovibacter TaxID=3299024 RepID=A0ABW6K297_9BACI
MAHWNLLSVLSVEALSGKRWVDYRLDSLRIKMKVDYRTIQASI